MTANEMAEELDKRVDRSSSYGSPGYEDFEYSSVLTEAQWLYIKKFFEKPNNRKGLGFEESEVRAQGLGELIKNGITTVSANQSGILPNGKFFDLPEDFMFTIAEYATISKNHCRTESPIIATVVARTHNEYQRYVNNPYKKPYYNKLEGLVWRMQYSKEVSQYEPGNIETNKRHELLTDGTFDTVSYVVRYLKIPNNIIVDLTTPANQRNCELSKETHDTIINIAKDLLLERVKEQKVQNIEQTKDLE